MSTLTLITGSANDCGNCTKLKMSGALDGIKSSVSASGNVSVVEITYNSMRDPLDSKYPASLANYIQWFPTFVLVNTSDWNAGLPAGSGVAVYNGEIRNGIAVYKGGPAPTPTSISSWVNTSGSGLAAAKVKASEEKTKSLTSSTVGKVIGPGDTTYSSYLYLLPAGAKQTTLTQLYPDIVDSSAPKGSSSVCTGKILPYDG